MQTFNIINRKKKLISLLLAIVMVVGMLPSSAFAEGEGAPPDEHSHTWDAGTVVSDSTCTEAGTMIHTCSCGATTDSVIQPKGHSFSEWTVTIPATCTADGTQTRTCSVCNTVETGTVPATGHQWGEWTYITEPTCTVGGERVRVCSVCGAEDDEILSALGHSWGEWTETVAATCTEAGSKTHTCNTCGTVAAEDVAALGHDWNDGEVTEEPDCVNPGVKTYTCLRCSDTKTENVPALGHDWDEGEVTAEPDCVNPGAKTFTCLSCNDTKTEEVPALGHEWGEWFDITEPTCSEVGSHTHTCAVCELTETEEIPTVDHEWSEWEVTTEPTCTEEGEQTRTCAVCEETETEAVPALGHTWDTDDEKAAATCTVCGETREDTYVYDIICANDLWRMAGNANLAETPEFWNNMFKDMVYSRDWAQDLLTIAVSQIGYHGESDNYIKNKAGLVRYYSRYGDWYGDSPEYVYGDWCAMFVSFCLYYARIPVESMPWESSCVRWVKALKDLEIYTDDEDYIPEPGDLIFFDYPDPEYDWEPDGRSDHVGIVFSVDEENGIVTTIEGAVNNMVDKHQYELGAKAIAGYGMLPENPELIAEALEALAAAMPAQDFEETVDDMTVTVSADIGAFPANTRMELRIVDDQEVLSAAAEAVMNTAGEAAQPAGGEEESGEGEGTVAAPAASAADPWKKVSQVRAVDITFYNEEGEEIEPLIPVRVTMKSTLINAANNADVVHIDDEGAAAKVESSEQDGIFSFDAGGFSIFVVVETETISTIYMTADGSTYEVTVSYDQSAGIPNKAQLIVSEITEENEAYGSYVDQTASVISTEASRLCYVKLLDISIVDEDGVDVVLDAPVDVQIRLLDKLTADNEANLQTAVVHFAEDSQNDSVQPEILDHVVEETTVSFSTDGFSVYAIVEAPGIDDIPPAGWTVIKSAAELRQYGGSGVYIRHIDGYYFTDEQFDINNSRAGILKTAQSTGDPSASGAALYYFESVPNTTNQFYIYTGEGANIKYLQGGYQSNSLRFQENDERSIFRLVEHNNPGGAENVFVLEYIAGHGASDKSVNMSGGADGAGFAIWKTKSNADVDDPNARLQLLYDAPPVEDPYDLDGKSYGIVHYDSDYNTNIAATGLAMMADFNSRGTLAGKEVEGKMEYLDFFDDFFLVPGEEITMWTFEYVDTPACNNYRMSTTVNGVKKYLAYSDNNSNVGNQYTKKLELHDEPDDATLLTVNGGSGDRAGMIQIQFTNAPGTRFLDNRLPSSPALTNGDFGNYQLSASNSRTWFYLATPTDIEDSAFKPYSATKISVSDPDLGAPYTDDHPKPKIIVYTRIWDEELNRYKFFAIDKDGSLVRCYDGGGEIFWYDIEPENLLWEFTEYLGSNGTPSFYYELQSWYYKSVEEVNRYIAPQITGDQIFSSRTIGVNMNGRRYGDYYSKIIAWDKPKYTYAGLLANQETNTLEAVPMSLSNDWYFAVIVEEEADEKLTVAETIDHTAYGISMRMFDYNNPSTAGNPSSWDTWQATVMGGYDNQSGGQNPKLGLVSRNLADDGYPTATMSGRSLSELFPSAPSTGVQKAQTVNHLFIQQTYNESGYFEFNSCQNYAYLDESSGNFIVYDQLGTFESNAAVPSTTIQHGQFDPYNQIGELDANGVWRPKYGHTKLYPRYNTEVTNRYDIHGNLLSAYDPRYGETLYKNGTRSQMDFHFGMELTATFMQSPNGKDDWGHDIIFEFSGDDDFWLYVDDVLVLDIGGTHYASDGWVNFATGQIYNQGLGYTTLRTVFTQAYLEKHPGDTAGLNDYLNEKFDGEVFKSYTSHDMKALYMERGANASNLHMRFNLAPVKPGSVELEKHIEGTNMQTYASVKFPYQIFWRIKGTEDWTQVTVAEQAVTVPAAHAVKVYYKNSGEPVDCAVDYPSEDPIFHNVFFLMPEQHALIEFPNKDSANNDIAPEDIEYYIQECYINTRIYDSVKANEIQLTGTPSPLPNTDDLRCDFPIQSETIVKRKLVSYVNHVNPDALRSLTVTKKLHGKEGPLQSTDPNDSKYDPTPFRFRLYLGDELEPYGIASYHVKDPNGFYCYRINDAWVSSGFTDFSLMNEDQQGDATFPTGPWGTADDIPTGYSVEIRGLLPETHFMVEEQPRDIPLGYDLGYTPNPVLDPYTGEGAPKDFVDYERILVGGNATYDLLQPGVYNKGVIKESEDAKVNVHNRKGWGLSIKKTWSDAEFMETRDDIYFAVYLRSGDTEPYTFTPVNKYVKALTSEETNAVFFLDELEPDVPFFEGEGEDRVPNYWVFEIQITDGVPVVDSQGYVTNAASLTFTRIGEGESLSSGGQQIGQSYAPYTYTASYGSYSFNTTGNAVSYSVTNSRPGVKIVKWDWNLSPLLDAEFTLKQGNEYYGSESYISGDYGLVLTAYFGTDLVYTLSELGAPVGYVPLPENVNITVDSENNVSVVSAEDPSNITIVYVESLDDLTEEQKKTADVIVVTTPDSDTEIATIIVRDRAAGLQLKKLSSVGDTPLEGVRFKLFRQNSSEGWSSMTTLVTDENGMIPVSSFATLPKNNRTYKLVEVEPYPDGHKPLECEIIFKLKPDGVVELISPVGTEPDADKVVLIPPEEGSENKIYTLQVTNEMSGYPIRIKKTTSSESVPLPGVQFVTSMTGTELTLTSGEDGILSYTDDEGTVVNVFRLAINTLDNPYYTLSEKLTQAGYDILPGDVTITVSAPQDPDDCPIAASRTDDTTVEYTVEGPDDDGVYTVIITNELGVELPKTGGRGTLAFTFGGAVLAAGSMLMLGTELRRRRRRKKPE